MSNNFRKRLNSIMPWGGQTALCRLASTRACPVYPCDVTRWLDGISTSSEKAARLEHWLFTLESFVESGGVLPDLRNIDGVRLAIEHFQSRTATREIASSHFEILFAAGAAQ